LAKVKRFRLCLLVFIAAPVLSACATSEELFAVYDDNFCRVAEYPAQKFIWERVVYFESDSAELTDLALSKIQANVSTLKQLNDYKISLKGFADPQGNVEYNKKLSARRVNSVSRVLVEKLGIDKKRIVSAAFGEEQPSTDNTEGPVEIDRRVEMLLLNPDVTPVIDQPGVRPKQAGKK